MNKKIFYLLFCFLTIKPTFAHLCHDPFRPTQHLVLVPEKELITIEETGSFRIYIENTFDTILYDVKLIVENPAFEIEIIPNTIQKLVPGERSFFVVELKLREGFLPDSYPLKINVEAKSSELTATVNKIDVVVEKKIKQTQIQQETQKSTTIQLILPQEEKIENTNQILQTKETFVSTSPQQKNLSEHSQEIVVKVEKIPFWKKPYFFAILGLITIIILLLRKTK
ncbi:MAG: hypothetical protein NZ928_05400 [Endomicrobia bacterium]|nr:hypothetical protein [Endomicrobiia bacterium]MDW8056582.1 hypothetical protein [Elusimicrobiota bacterium]